MFHSIILKNLTNSEFIQFNKNIANLIQQKNPELLAIEALYNTYTGKIAEHEALFKIPTGSPITAEMEALDFRRDDAITGIIGMVSSHAHHYLPIKKEAAVALQNNLKLYSSNIQRENYQSETAIINNLINDWKNKPELTAAMTTLALNDWIDELDIANNLFDEKYVNRAQTYASAPIETQKSKRMEVMNAYYDVRKYLEAHSLLNPSPLYESLISEANQIIDLYVPLTKSKKKETAVPPVS